MPLKALLWGGFFTVACGAALWSPIWGIIAYVMQYTVAPASQWWHYPLRSLELRYSFTAAAFVAAGMALNWNQLRFGESIFHRHEKLMLAFLGVMWVLWILGPQTAGRYYAQSWLDNPAEKMAKVLVFVWMLTHVVTDTKKLNWLLWALVLGALFLGNKAYNSPPGAFTAGRLEGVGGADFRDANYFAAYMAGMLFIIGVQFMRTGWWGKTVCFVAGGFTANAVVLTRSRGAFLGVVVGLLAAVMLAPKRYRVIILVGALLAGMGGLYLADPGFLNRVETITETSAERDNASIGRLTIWKGAMQMILANPQGVGPGNFYQNIDKYAPGYGDYDAHNTFLRCACELGVLGVIVFSMILISAFLLLLRTMKTAATLPKEVGDPVLWAAFGTMTSLVAVLADGMTQTFVYTEFLWWLLALPLCLSRTLDNLVNDQADSAGTLDSFSAETESYLEPVAVR